MLYFKKHFASNLHVEFEFVFKKIEKIAKASSLPTLSSSDEKPEIGRL